MANHTLQKLQIIDADTVAGRKVVYCTDACDVHSLIGRRFVCGSPPLEITIENVSTCGTSELSALAYTGDSVPPGRCLEFAEVQPND